MKKNFIASILLLACAFASCKKAGQDAVIRLGTNASLQERLAATELRRYLYLRTEVLVPVQAKNSTEDLTKTILLVAAKGQALLDSVSDEKLKARVSGLGDDEYLITTVSSPRRRTVLIAGGSALGALYGAYRYIEDGLGVRFYLHGDIVPDKKMPFQVPAVEAQGKPLFPIRGIQPFHDFPEGPDWWNADEYKAVLAQLPKMGMNFIGLHTYPEGNPNAEPTVWIGMSGEVGEKGKVSAGYPSSWQNTQRGNWGYEAKQTSDFHCGAADLFDEDSFGAEVMKGMMPEPKTPEESNTLFERTGRMLGDVFALAAPLGIKTCVGTETPLTIPAWVQNRLRSQGLNPTDPKVVRDLYKGIFERLARTSPPTYYWFWTNEGWTWSDAGRDQVRAVVQDLGLAIQGAQELHNPFKLATCGWVLGPPSDRSLFDRTLPKDMTVSCINREVGKAPVDVNFSRISGRSKWVIPWLEDDPSLSSPQLWAGRMRRDAADALAYGCDGLLGIHWRTRILSANVKALARAAWEQKSWNPEPANRAEIIGPVNGVYASFPDKAIAGTDEAPLYRDVRDKVFGYHLAVPNGRYNVTLKFCEGEMDKPGARVFDVSIEGKKVLERLDIFEAAGRYSKIDFNFLNMQVRDGRLDIDFADRIGYPCIAGLVVQGPGYSKKINCGGPAIPGYEADWPETPRFAPVKDFYEDWARNQFGEEASSDIAAIFSKIDGRLPVPATWVGGPGGLNTSARPWDEVSKDYAFVDELAALRPRVQGPGNAERFDYWLNNFRYMKEIARLDGLAAEYNKALEETKKLDSDSSKKQKALESLLPLRVKIVATVKAVFEYLLPTVSNTGELGTVANWEQHILPPLLEKTGQELETLLGRKLPAEAQLDRVYAGPTRVFVPTTRTSLRSGEPLELKIMVLSSQKPDEVALYWRPMGSGIFQKTAPSHAARGVYRVQLPPLAEDIEYYVEARVAGKGFVFPATAPDLNQTVVLMK